MLAFSLALPRVAPLAARPARQLSIADFAVKLTVIQIPQGKAFCSRKTAPPSTRVSNHSIFQKEKRTAWVRFSFWSRWRESNSPGTAWEAVAIPLGDTCVCFRVLIIAVFIKIVNGFFFPFCKSQRFFLCSAPSLAKNRAISLDFHNFIKLLFTIMMLIWIKF